MSFKYNMDTLKNQPLHFGAKFIKNVNIQKYNSKSHLYSNTKANFVKFEPENQSDINAIVSTAKAWKDQTFAGAIAQRAMYIVNGILNKDTNHVYVLTTQQSNLKKMKPGKILGMAHMSCEPEENELKFFQVNPKQKYGASKREYKHIGTGILNSLKELYKNSIELSSTYQAAEFYEKQGFKAIAPLRYRWEG